MDILYLAPYRQNDTWGESSRALLSSLLLTEHNVSSRPIFFSNNTCPIDPQLEQLETKPINNHDVVIEKGLPFVLEYNGRFQRNIGIYSAESNHIRHTSWPTHLNVMDELWVANQQQINILQQNRVTFPTIYQVPEPLDTTIIRQPHVPLAIPDTTDTFNFYYIGDLSDRDNLQALIIAFHTTFNVNSQVNLILNMHTSPQEADKFISNIKQNLRLYPTLQQYKKEIFINRALPFTDMCQSHETAHCLVLPSKSPGVSRLALYAMGFGNMVLCSTDAGTCEFMEPSVRKRLKVNSQDEITYCTNPPLPYLYSGHEHWANISTAHLQKRMLQVYRTHLDSPNIYQEHSKLLREYIQQTLSYQAVADTINGVLKQ